MQPEIYGFKDAASEFCRSPGYNSLHPDRWVEVTTASGSTLAEAAKPKDGKAAWTTGIDRQTKGVGIRGRLRNSGLGTRRVRLLCCGVLVRHACGTLPCVEGVGGVHADVDAGDAAAGRCVLRRAGVADRFGRKRPLIACVLFFSLLTVLTGLAPNYFVFVICRALYGVGME